MEKIRIIVFPAVASVLLIQPTNCTVILLGLDEVLANVNLPSIQYNQMEIKVQMHRFIIYAGRVILIKQTKAGLAGEMQHCWIHNNIKHINPPKLMKHPNPPKSSV